MRSWARRSFILAVAALLTLGGAPVGAEDAKRAKLRLASDIWPPFTGSPGEPRVAIELVRRALERADIASEVSMVDVGRLTPGLEQGRFDGTAAIWKSAAREKYLLYSAPYLENRLVLVGRKSSDVAYKDLSELKGKRVAIVSAFAYGDEIAKAKGVRFVKGESDQDNLRKLLLGQTDYILVDALIAHRLVTLYRAEADRLLQVGSQPMITRTLHFAVRRDVKGAAAIVAKFDAQIHKMIVDGSIHKILEVNWIEADMDGDGRSELVLGGKKAGAKPPVVGYELLTLKEVRPGAPKRSRIWIEGQTYENWDDVPPRYKVEPEPIAPQRKGGIRFRFDIGL